MNDHDDPNLCPYCHSLDCAYVRAGADCPVFLTLSEEAENKTPHMVNDMNEILTQRGYEPELLGPGIVGMAKRSTTKMLLVTEENGEITIGLYPVDAEDGSDATYVSISGKEPLTLLPLILTTLETLL